MMGLEQDWRTLDLSVGRRSLLEASAGTGKTWTLSVLYLRLLLEQGLSPRQIVVTTFTNAAAEELRERLRSRLLWAEALAENRVIPATDADALDALWLQTRWQSAQAVYAVDRQRLQLALAELDMAPITTLHGLCQKILSEHPFASGALFSGGDLMSGIALQNELAKDLYRHLLQGDPEQDVLARLYSRSGLQLVADTLPKMLGQLLMPGSHIRHFDASELDRMLPPERAAELREASLCFGKATKLGKAFARLAEILQDREAAGFIDSDFESTLSRAAELKGVLKAHLNAPHLAETAAFAVSLVNSGVLHFKTLHFWVAAADWARAQAKIRLTARNQRSFDALLTDVHTALQGATGRSLADALFAAWPVALVDEFQDTDGIQYGILDAIYRNSEADVRGHLLVVGDPKQAIYRFRGGDIHAYQRAAAKVPESGRMRLATNRRSSRAYVAAVNAWYALCGEALGAETDNICYQPVLASDRNAQSPYTIAGVPCAQPLQFHFAADLVDASNPRCTQQALTVCANQIQQMLHDGQHAIAGQHLQPADIAVLLPSHRHISQLRELLQSRGIPCISTTRYSVFASESADELQIILYAVLHADQPGALRAAMATRIWGFSYAQIATLNANAVLWQESVQVFHQWQAIWRQRGVQAVVHALIGQVANMQLASTTGERVLTDLRHLGELLQVQSAQYSSFEALLAWFAEQRDGGDDDEDSAENRQQRIESDAACVHLLTLHASKGLEFPIVFLPMMWAHVENRHTGLYQVGTTDDGMRLWQIGEAAKHIASGDLQAERFRVLYVALTRAIHACHVLALPPERKAAPVLERSRSALDLSISRMQCRPNWMAEISVSTGIAWHDDWQPGQDMPMIRAADAAPLIRKVRKQPDSAEGPLPARHSFSTLTRHAMAFLPAEDDIAEALSGHAAVEAISPILSGAAPEQVHPQLTALMAVAGTNFGNAVHAIFEQRVAGCPLHDQKPLIARCLAENNVYCPEIPPTVLASLLAERLQAVLDTPLRDSGAQLGVIPASDLRAEMEFHYALSRADMVALRDLCAAHGEQGLVPVQFQHLSGLMTGKIDLVFRHGQQFHVLDYKSNRLGEQLSDYQGIALQAAMDAHHYRFQALLYTLAVDRYLRQRIPDYVPAKHLGDCYYLFVRAVGLDRQSGIWRHRFSDTLIHDIQMLLAKSAMEPAI